MVIYSKLIKPPFKTSAAAAATSIVANENQFEDPYVAQNTLFYDHHGQIIPNLVYYDTDTHRGKKRLPNGLLKDCFIKKVRVTIGQFGINPSRKNDEVHLESIKEVVKSGVSRQAQTRLMADIEECIKEKRRREGRPKQ